METPVLGVSNRLLNSLPTAEAALLKPQLKTIDLVQGPCFKNRATRSTKFISRTAA